MKIRHKENRSKPWELDCGVVRLEAGKRRVLRYFSTKAEAVSAMNAMRAGRLEHGRAGDVSPRELAEVALLKARLAKVGAGFSQAVEFFLSHAKVVREVVTLGEWVERALEMKRASGARESYLGALRVVWRGFARGRESVKLVDVVRVDLETWLAGGGWARRTQASKLGDLRALFAMAEKAELIAMDPTKGVEVRVLRDETEVSCMTPAQARRLLDVMRDHAPDFLAYVALGVFAGLRTVEIEKLGAGDIQLDDAIVVVSGASAKTRARRVVRLSENAVAWLRVWMKDGHAAVLPFSWERRWAALREMAGWKLPWPKNVMRHTAASMHFAMHGDEAALKTMLGHHASEDTLHRHYRAVKMLDGCIITGKIAGEFWGIVPR